MNNVVTFTEDYIKKGLREIVSVDANFNQIMKLDQYGGLTEDELLDRCASDLYSDALGLYMKEHMESVYLCDGLDEVQSIGKCLDEIRSSTGIELVQKLWTKPAVYVGYQSGNKTGFFDKFDFFTNYLTYVDVDGDVFVVEEYSVCPHGYADPVSIAFRKLCSTKDCASLSQVQEMFPEYLRIF